MARCLGPLLLLLLLLLLLGSPSSEGRNRCVDAAEACTADALCQQLRTEYVARCLDRAAPGGCPRARCRRALRRFFARGPPALTHALLFCPCAGPACAERRRQTFVPACAFSGPGLAPPSCLAPLDACEHSRVCRCARGCGFGGRGGVGRGREEAGQSLPPVRSPHPRPPRRPRLLAFQASCAPAPSAPDGCLPDQAPSCRRAYAGLVGTAITPNYVDNASARVAPWCDCGASGNRREECEAFRGLFTRNRCLVLYRPLSAGGPQSCRTSSTPSRTLGTASYRCPLQMSPRRGAPCSSCSLSWLSSPCSDCDSRPRTIQTAAPPCLAFTAPSQLATAHRDSHLCPMTHVGKCFLSMICCLVGTTRSENQVSCIALTIWLSSPWFNQH
ncbi:GDNF family receptor alpha-4 isoform X3 [Equus quagga]|uniref:GDNF family receptor alpha-4 isoform X3 n=1 Tax=Equus quagga TaxID=89248 RepID=UPI001EE1D1E8|nr:GDNF family receptor alpha-4 isoform X3 [Equus quagga]